MALIKTQKYKVERGIQKNFIKQWFRNEKTIKLFDEGTFSPTNNNGLKDIISDGMNSGILELIQNIKEGLAQGVTSSIGGKQIIVNRISNVAETLKGMGFEYRTKPEIRLKTSHAETQLNGIKKFFKNKSNLEYLDSVISEQKYYPAGSPEVIKNIYKLINSKDEEIKEELSTILNEHFGLNLEEVAKLDLYNKNSFDTKVSSNIEKLNKSEVDSMDSNELIKELTKNDEISSDEVLEMFVGKVLNMEMGEVKAWLVTAIKSDLKDIKEILKEDIDIIDIKSNIFTFINSRSLVLKGKEISSPFIFEKGGKIDFNKSKAGMPDVLYFPKNENSKPICAMNVTTDSSPDKSNTILIHMTKSSLIGLHLLNEAKEQEVEIGEILYEYKDLNYMGKPKITIGNDLSNTFNRTNKAANIDYILENKDSITPKKIFESLDFSVTLNSSSLSIYNNQKITTSQRNMSNPDYLDKIEKLNVLSYSFSQSMLENSAIDQYERSVEGRKEPFNSDEKKYLKSFLNEVVEKMNFSILSNQGDFTTIEARTFDKYAIDLASLFTDENLFQDFKEANQSNKDGSLKEEFKSVLSSSFNKLLLDKVGSNTLIQGIADGGKIDLESIVKKDGSDNLSTIIDNIDKVIQKYDGKEINGLNNKIDNLKSFIKDVSSFKETMKDRNNIGEDETMDLEF